MGVFSYEVGSKLLTKICDDVIELVGRKIIVSILFLWPHFNPKIWVLFNYKIKNIKNNNLFL